MSVIAVDMPDAVRAVLDEAARREDFDAFLAKIPNVPALPNKL